MNDDKATNAQNQGTPLPRGGSRKRPPPTIELQATDVTETTPEGETPPPFASADEEKRASWRARLKDLGARLSRARSSSPSSSTEGGLSTRQPLKPVAVMLLSALSGAVAALLIGSIWFATRPDAPAPDNSATIALGSRVTQLESKLAAPRDDSAATKRIAAIDAMLGELRKDIATLRSQSEATAANVSALKSSDSKVISPDLSAIEERLAKIEQTTPSAPASVVQVAPAADDTAVRLSLVATALDQAVNRGDPFGAELAAATKLGGDAVPLKLLAPFGATGVPTAQSLSRELLEQLPRVENANESAPASSGVIERLRDSASRLVRITRVDANGADRASVLSRARLAAQRDSLTDARRVVAMLPDDDRATLKGWTDKVDAREAALAATRRFVQEVTTALPKTGAPADPR